MDIVIEGPDNAGKSTLARVIAVELGFEEVTHSGGPSKYPGEINERAVRFNSEYSPSNPRLFDRHPCVSQNIYINSLFAGMGEFVTPDNVKSFYRTQPFIVYCRNESHSLQGHVMSEHSDDEYFQRVTENIDNLCHHYDQWAMGRSHYIHRIGDDIGPLLSALSSTNFDPVRDITAFHEKFGLAYHGGPRLLEKDLRDFRLKFMQEELDEYDSASLPIIDEKPQLAECLDGLVDLVYVALGTSYLHGFNFREAWRRVHEANMRKIRVERASQSKRGSTFDVIKPEGWVAPDLSDLVE